MRKHSLLLFCSCIPLVACGVSQNRVDDAATSMSASASDISVLPLSVTAKLTPPYDGKKVMDATILIGDERFGVRIDPTADPSIGNLTVTLFDVQGGQLPVWAPMSLSAPHCIAYTYDGTFPKLYIDGVEVAAPGGGPIHFRAAGDLTIDSPSIVTDPQISMKVLSSDDIADAARKCK